MPLSLDEVDAQELGKIAISLMERLERRVLDVKNVDKVDDDASGNSHIDVIEMLNRYARKLILFHCLKWYMYREVESDMVMFYFETQLLKLGVGIEATQAAIVERVKDTYDRYLKTDAFNEVDVQPANREQVLQAISSGKCTRDTFDATEEDVVRAIKSDYYIRLFRNPVLNCFAANACAVLPHAPGDTPTSPSSAGGTNPLINIITMLRTVNKMLLLWQQLDGAPGGSDGDESNNNSNNNNNNDVSVATSTTTATTGGTGSNRQQQQLSSSTDGGSKSSRGGNLAAAFGVSKETKDPLTVHIGLLIRSCILAGQFAMFVAKEFNFELISFWLDVTDFKGIDKTNETKLSAWANEIFNRYIKAGAEKEVNLSDVSKDQIQTFFIKNNIHQGMYDKALLEVFNLLRQNSYERFIKASEYIDFQDKYRRLPDLYSVDIDRLHKEKVFRERFRLPINECVIVEIPCSLQKRVTLHGRMFLGRDNICFLATVFGYTSKEQIRFLDIKEISKAAPPAITSAEDDHNSSSSHHIPLLSSHYDNHHHHQHGDSFIITLNDGKQWHFADFHGKPRLSILLRKCWLASEMRATMKSHREDSLSSMSAAPITSLDILTDTDWELFQDGANVKTFKRNQVLFKEGESNRNLYHIVRGRVRMEKKGVPVRSLEEGSLFGEMSFLEGTPTAADVVSDEDRTTVYAIDGNYVEGLRSVEPGLPGRFYRSLAMHLADKLRTKKVPAQAAAAASSATATTSAAVGEGKLSNEKFSKLFGLPAEERLLHAWEGALERKMHFHGQLYVSQNYLCFHAKILGMKTKEIINFRTVDAITSTERSFEVMVSSADAGSREIVFSGFENLDTSYEAILQVWRESKRKNVQQAPIKIIAIENIESGEGKTSIMSKADLDMFLTGAKLLSFKKDEVILAEGARSKSLFQIARGFARVQKTASSAAQSDIVLRKMGPGVMFGEMSFLVVDGGTASASIIADGPCEVYVIEHSFVESLLHSNPEVPGRFYKFLALNLANRLRK